MFHLESRHSEDFAKYMNNLVLLESNGLRVTNRSWKTPVGNTRHTFANLFCDKYARQHEEVGKEVMAKIENSQPLANTCLLTDVVSFTPTKGATSPFL